MVASRTDCAVALTEEVRYTCRLTGIEPLAVVHLPVRAWINYGKTLHVLANGSER